MFGLFGLFKEKEKIKVKIHNRLIDVRIGRKYARGENMDGNTYECFNHTAEEVYNQTIDSSDDLENVNKSYFIEGYDLQTEELSRIVKIARKTKR